MVRWLLVVLYDLTSLDKTRRPSGCHRLGWSQYVFIWASVDVFTNCFCWIFSCPYLGDILSLLARPFLHFKVNKGMFLGFHVSLVVCGCWGECLQNGRPGWWFPFLKSDFFTLLHRLDLSKGEKSVQFGDPTIVSLHFADNVVQTVRWVGSPIELKSCFL